MQNLKNDLKATALTIAIVGLCLLVAIFTL